MLIILPLLIAIVGLVVYAISVNPKAQVIAEDCFWVGLFVFLLKFAGNFALPR
jgi:hypothetical protein